ncbi:MAG TPA: hypothetical protein VFG66_13635 [Gemmatimonadales bacterium]|nr:hypothetical protein [Gemmatimonadales bacterium]
MRPLAELGLPPRRPWPWIAILASLAVHGLLLFGFLEAPRPAPPHRSSAILLLLPPAEGPAAVPMPYRTPAAPGRTPTGTSTRRSARPALRPPPRTITALPEPRPEPAPVDTGGAPASRPRPSIGRIGPGLANGRLWVRPLPLPPKELAQRLSRDHVQLVDSAVTAIVQAYLDSIANEPSSRGQTLPSWTTEVAGKKFGIDSKSIYIAGLKIPAAVLALLPIGGGNIDQNRAYNHLMDMRADLQYAAQRAENLEEFKTMIREMRLRKEREREFERNQRTAPPPEEPATP